jgi:rhamnogalacturonan endolyase
MVWAAWLALGGQAQAQPRYDFSSMQMEKLGRGVVAFRSGNKVVVSWRMLRQDPSGAGFDVYRNGVKLTHKPMSQGGTFFIDEKPLTSDATYTVKGGSCDGSFTLTAQSPDGYLAIPLQKPVSTDSTWVYGGRMRRGGNAGQRQPASPTRQLVTYTANDASVGDVDGDGQYEIILKWDPSNAQDNSRAGYTSNVYFDCYRLDGTRLWRIDMGRNIRAGAHYTQFIVYDLDGDGRAEVMMKTADGTIDGTGKAIGDASRDWREKKEGDRLGRIMSGPEYLTVFDGLTGRALKTVDYVPDRGPEDCWGDDHANRSDRYLAALAYLDGHRPSAVFCRGYYTRTTLAAWQWDGKDLKLQWYFDTHPQPEQTALMQQLGLTNHAQPDYAGQGNHNLRVADVDGDGCDEIIYGAMAVDNDGKPLHNTEFGHGDALHLVVEPHTGRLQVWDCHENKRDGSSLRDAATGEVIFQKKANFDVGRAMAADIDPTHEGFELWSACTGGLLDSHGNRLTPPTETKKGAADDDSSGAFTDYSDQSRGPRNLSCNFGIWWDGDTLRELLDHEAVTKYNWKKGSIDLVKRFDGAFNNGTKSNPCLSADILGDWREEVVMRDRESTELRIYISDIPTPYRATCLMQDPPYRESVAAENVAYNQPPELGRWLSPLPNK